MTAAPWSREEFEAQLRTQGRAYHIHHPFNVLLNSGAATAAQIRGWVANRFYYQINIPIKDAAILANCEERVVRRAWVQRILDHDGYGEDPGGIESWLRYDPGTACRRNGTGVGRLMIINSSGQRHQDRGPADRGEFGDRAGAGA